MTELLQAAGTLGPVGLAIIVTVIVMLKFGPGAKRDEKPYEGPERRGNHVDACVVSPDMKKKIYQMEKSIEEIKEVVMLADPLTTRKLVHFPPVYEQSIVEMTSAIKSLTETAQRLNDHVS